MACPVGFEPTTSTSAGSRSIQAELRAHLTATASMKATDAERKCVGSSSEALSVLKHSVSPLRYAKDTESRTHMVSLRAQSTSRGNACGTENSVCLWYVALTPDVLVPEVRVCTDELLHQFDASSIL